MGGPELSSFFIEPREFFRRHPLPLLWISLSFLAGLALGDGTNLPVILWLLFAVLAGLLWVGSLWGERRFRWLGYLARAPQGWFSTSSQEIKVLLPALSLPLLGVVLCLGAGRMQAVKPILTPTSLAWYNDWDTSFLIEGVVITYADERDQYTQLRLQVERIHPLGSYTFIPVEGKLLARVPAGKNWRYGDRLRLEGALRTPPQDDLFSYRDYLYRQGVLSYFSCSWEGCARLIGHGYGNPLLDGIYTLRGKFEEVLYALFPDPEASLLDGILLGIEGRIPQDVAQAFKDTGTAHIIAISGFNFSVLAALFMRLFGRLFGRWRGMLVAFFAMAGYAMLAGANPAVVRAALMGILAVLAVQLGRRQNGLNSLALVSAVIAFFNPHVLWEVSFQLSAMATLGLVLYADRFTQAFMNFAARYVPSSMAQRLAAPVGAYFLYTLAAQLTTLPITFYHFQVVSLLSLLANIAVLPVQPLLMVSGAVTALVGALSLSLGRWISLFTWPLTAYTIRVVEWFAAIPTSTMGLNQVSLAFVGAFYLALFAWTALGHRLSAWIEKRASACPSRAPGFALLILASLTIVVWQAVLAAPDGHLHVTLLDIGSGDALLVVAPGGGRVLIDGGPSPSKLADALGRRFPLIDRRLDALVVAGVSEEQLGALPWVIQRYPPREVLWSGAPAASFSARQLRGIIVKEGLPMARLLGGQVLDLGDGVRLRVLEVTRRGSVLLLEWKHFAALFPVGLDFDSMARLMDDRSLPPVTVLLLAESGYAPLNPPEWLRRWHPHCLLLSVAAEDLQGRPDMETLNAAEGYTLLRTDMYGWIELITDGEHLWVETERRGGIRIP